MAVYSIGEALIDFLPEGGGFIPSVGGAPCNVASCVAKLDGKSYLISKVGDDLFGNKIIRELKEVGVGVEYVGKTDCANTALAFVSLAKDGEREFSFYRNPSADMFLEKKDIAGINFTSEDILHFCSVDLIDMPVRYATEAAIEKCRRAGALVSFDPNVRKNLWKNQNEYRSVISEFLPKADIIKLAADECDFIFGSKDAEFAASKLLGTAKIVIITTGAKGSSAYTKDGIINQTPYKIKCVDTTGAGDTYIGAFLRYFRTDGIKAAMNKASAASAIVCSKKGVLPSLPDEHELDTFIERNGL
jgi:fructokinase